MKSRLRISFSSSECMYSRLFFLLFTFYLQPKLSHTCLHWTYFHINTHCLDVSYPATLVWIRERVNIWLTVAGKMWRVAMIIVIEGLQLLSEKINLCLHPVAYSFIIPSIYRNINVFWKTSSFMESEAF